MWKNRPDKHCSDDVLLAHLDGELNGFARLRTAAHLRRCWECRAHLSELEHNAEALARLVEKQLARNAGLAGDACTAFLRWKEQFERDNAPGAPPRRTYALRWSLAAAAAAVLGILAVVPRHPADPPKPVPTAAEVLRGVRAYQTGLKQAAGTLHQTLSVEVVQSRPSHRRSSARVDIWSDRAGGRYASRWMDERQKLKFAVWRRPGKAPFVYAAATGAAAAGPLFDPGSAGLTVDGLERAFFDWLGTQDWQAAPDFSEAVARDGTRLHVERPDAGTIRIRASRRGNTLRADFTMELDAGSFRPRLQTMRFETADRALELRVTADRLEVIPLARIDPAVFEPDAPRIPILTVPAAPPRRDPPPAAPVEDLETEVLYAVHRTRACVGENVKVTSLPNGELEVRAIVQNEQRRAELAGVLQGIGGGRIRADIQVAAYAGAGPERAHPLLPADGVRVLDGLYLEALALMRLAERYGPEQRAILSDRQRKLVDVMVRDHAAALRSGTRLARTQVEPVLMSLAGAPAGHPALPEPADWSAAAAEIFRALDKADNLIDVPNAGRKHAAAHLLRALAELELRVEQLDGTVTAAQR